MSGGSLRMSDAETLKFLEYYKNEPALWDPANEGYKNKETRSAAAQRIAEALNIPDFTASHVIVKFKNLRSSYAQELKKIVASMKTGVSSDNIYVPKVIWFKLMNAFLRPYVKSRAMLYNSDNSFQETIGMHDNSFQEFTNLQSETEVADENVIKDCSEQPESSTRIRSTVIHNIPIDKPKSLKRPLLLKKHMLQKRQRLESNTSASAGIIMAVMNKVEKIMEKNALKDDSFDCFGRYMASLLRNLPKQKALTLQQEITTLVVNEQISTLKQSK